MWCFYEICVVELDIKYSRDGDNISGYYLLVELKPFEFKYKLNNFFSSSGNMVILQS